MSSPTGQAFAIYELTAQILLHINDPVELVRAQRVCRAWRDIIQTSPALQAACWYPPSTQSLLGSVEETQPWTLNPAFSRLGFKISKDISDKVYSAGGIQERADLSLEERIYDKPGSWTTMLATRPPMQRIMIGCYGDYSGDETMWYLVFATKGPVLVGDVLATLAEAQNRQECGIDRWAGVRHYTGALVRWTASDWDEGCDWRVLDDMLRGDEVDVNVVVCLPWGMPDAPAFSLRRVHCSKEEGFLCEMVVHTMVMEGGEVYEWDYWNHGGCPGWPLCKGEGYKSRLLVVRELPEWYREKCKHSFRQLSDVLSQAHGSQIG